GRYPHCLEQTVQDGPITELSLKKPAALLANGHHHPNRCYSDASNVSKVGQGMHSQGHLSFPLSSGQRIPSFLPRSRRFVVGYPCLLPAKIYAEGGPLRRRYLQQTFNKKAVYTFDYSSNV